MVAGAAFPVAKLGFLLIKQVSKPIAKQIAARAKNSRLFREYVCIPVAQLFHWYEIKMKMRMLNIGGKVTKVPKLNDAKAVEQGAEILSEFIIISIASAILIYEYNRSKEKEDAKETARVQDTEKIKNKIFELEFKQEKQTTQIRELSKLVIELKEQEHKHSLKRIFKDKPELSTEILNSAQEEAHEVIPLQLSEAPPSQDLKLNAEQENVQKSESAEKSEAADNLAPKAGEENVVKEQRHVIKKGQLLKAIDDM